MEEQAGGGDAARNDSNSSKRLVRSRSDQWIAGVCGGLGRFFGIDSNLVRVVLAASTLFGGAGLVLYLVCWLVLPMEGEPKSIGDQLVERINQSSKGEDPKEPRDEL